MGQYRESPPVVVNTFEYTEETPMHRITHRDGGSHRSKHTRQSSIYAALLATRFATTWPRLVPFILQMCMESTCHAGIAIAAVDAVQFGNYNVLPTHKAGFGMHSSKFTAIGDDYVRLCNILRAKCSKQVITQPVALRFSNPGLGLLNFAYDAPTVILEQSLYDFRNSVYFEEGKVAQKEAEVPLVNGDGHVEAGALSPSTTPKLFHSLYKMQELCMGEKYKGKPHLGLYFNFHDDIWKNHGDAVKEFAEIYRKFNPHRTFCNAFTKESGLDKLAGL